MNVVSVLTLGPATAFPGALAGAVRTAFPQAALLAVPDLAAASARPPCPGLEMMMLAGPETTGATSPAPDSLQDENQLPRWAVLRFGEGEVPAEGWTGGTLAVLLKEAAARHALARNQALLQGGLMTMARRISHDLRTPLGGILATVDMLSETFPQAAGPAQSIASSVEEMTQILTRTSSLCKAMAQPQPLQALAMGSAVHGALIRLERTLQHKEATLRQPEVWPEVAGVAPWLDLIWWNLIHNALQHGGPAPVITLTWEEDGQGYRFRVQNSGPVRKAVEPPPAAMVPFHLLHQPHAPKGLGLTIVRTLTGLLGGTCGSSANPDGGATFYFTLPGAPRTG